VTHISRRTLLRAAAAALPALASRPGAAQSRTRTRNVFLVMTDGLRWQEVFRGADAALLNKESGVADPDALRREYWRDTPQARREALMPFLWTTMARKGQIFGNRDAASEVSVANGMNFSYPGYSETLCGFADPRIDSNNKVPNPNVTVLEWLHGKPAYRGRIAAFGAWDVFPFIFNAQRAGFPVNAGYDPFVTQPPIPQMDLINKLKSETRVWDSEAMDSFTFRTALEYVKQQKPRVLFLSLGETDEWAHEGKYAAYLHSAARVDASLKELWETAQALREYRDSTTLIFSCDHGRGEAPVEWKSHGQKVPDSKYIWMGFLGPDTRPLGERRDTAPLQQNQIAGTLAQLLGEDYRAATPKAGEVIEAVVKK
jgi:hypothetical protein